MSDVSKELAQDLARVEQEVFRSTVEAASPDVARALGLAMRDVGSGLVIATGRLDVLMYNCVFGLGVSSPARESDVDRAIELFREAGSRRCMANLAPDATPPELSEWLEARGFGLHNHWIKL